MKEVIPFVNVVGAGLAGCEAALFLADHDVKVHLFEMKPAKKSPAHKSDNFAELVCSNSLKSEDMLTASGLLKEELKILGSQILDVAYKCKIPAGGALAVDREMFSRLITNKIKNHPNITVICETITEINLTEPTIIATGPLTDDELYKDIQKLLGEQNCYFYDAIAPIISKESIDFNYAFWGNRYGKGDTDGDYVNCTLSKEEYEVFVKALLSAERVKLKEFENIKVFEGCMPIEIMAERGFESLRFGPMKPIGLFDTTKDKRPYAVLQLRREDENAASLNMVGFQTNLTYPEQKRVFGLIPALKNADYLRYGSMHRNSYINAPNCLDEFSRIRKYPKIFVAGQLSGVEGYMESVASGLFCAYNMCRLVSSKMPLSLPNSTCLGALMHHIAYAPVVGFQPMNANYSIIADIPEIKDKKEKRRQIFESSIKQIRKFKDVFDSGYVK